MNCNIVSLQFISTLIWSSHHESIHSFIEQCILKWSNSDIYHQYFQELLLLAGIHTQTLLERKFIRHKSRKRCILDLMCQMTRTDLLQIILECHPSPYQVFMYLFDTRQCKEITSLMTIGGGDTYLSYVLEKAFIHCRGKTQLKFMFDEKFFKNVCRHQLDLSFQTILVWQHHFSSHCIEKVKRQYAKHKDLNKSNDIVTDDIPQIQQPQEKDEKDSDDPEEEKSENNVNESLPVKLIECQCSDLILIIQDIASFNDETINPHKDNIIQYIKTNQINGKSLLDTKLADWSASLIAFTGNKKVRGAANKVYNRFVRYYDNNILKVKFSRDYKPQNEDLAEMQRIVETYDIKIGLKVDIQKNGYDTHTKMYQEIEKLVKMHGNEKRTEHRLKFTSTNKLRDLHRKLGAKSGSFKKNMLVEQIKEELDTLYENAEFNSDDDDTSFEVDCDDDDRKTQSESLRPANKFQWLFNDMTINFSNNKPISPEYNPQHYKCTDCDVKYNTTSRYPNRNYLKKVITTLSNEMVGWAYHSDALDRVMMETAIKTGDEEINAWKNWSKRRLEKLDSIKTSEITQSSSGWKNIKIGAVRKLGYNTDLFGKQSAKSKSKQ